MRTALVTMTAPKPFIQLVEAKQHLRVDTADEDDLIAALNLAVCGALDGPDGIMHRAIGKQSLKLVLPGFSHGHYTYSRYSKFPGTSIELPLPPATDVSEITYYDSDNAAQTLAPDQYSLIACGTAPSILIPAFGTWWPATACRPDAVSITFDAGFNDDNPVPGPIIAAAKLMLGDLYLNREATVYGPGAALENPAVKALLSPWRILKL